MLRGTAMTKKRIAELRTNSRQQLTLFKSRSSRTQQLTFSKAVSIHHKIYSSLKDKLRVKDGAVVAIAGGVEIHAAASRSLKSPGSGRDYFFAVVERGMSAAGSVPNNTAARLNSMSLRSWRWKLSNLSCTPVLRQQLGKPANPTFNNHGLEVK